MKQDKKKKLTNHLQANDIKERKERQEEEN